MEDFVNHVNANNADEISPTLDKFCKENAQKMTFSELNENGLRGKILSILFEKLSDEKYAEINSKILETLRILSRDKTNLDSLITDERLDLIIKKADLTDPAKPPYNNVVLEALKLLCNLIYNSACVQIQITKTSCLANLIKRISIYDETVSYKMQMFDVRILFLITALNITSRNVVKNEFNGDKQLIDLLSQLSQKINESNDTIDVACEVLKTLFNLYIDAESFVDDQKQEYEKLIEVLYKLLTTKITQSNDELQSHIVNLFTVMPYRCYSTITPPIKNMDECTEVYENKNMSAVYEFLKFFDRRLDTKNNFTENISPVVTALLKLSQSQRAVRKYLRQKVLPPLRKNDVMQRPEDGTNLRAKLCKLLTSSITELRDLVAEFLFVLCKENVGRMIKYTGYGNAAGMFANKGLLGCKQPETQYSSESGESDTEEYVKYKEAINPVTGCYETPKPSPFEGMTEEQKEYEAIKLINLVSQLSTDGFVRPCTIGEDGKPKPVEHVLELREGLQHGPKVKNVDSDSE